MTDEKTLEVVARAVCFANCAHIDIDGEVFLERGCSCKTEEDCFEINELLRKEMLGQAQAAIDAYLKTLEAEGKRIMSERDIQELTTSRKVYEG